MKTRCDRHYGLGPLFFAPPEGGEGGAAPPAGGAPAGDSGKPPAPPAGAPPAGGQPEQTIPYARFVQVNDELQTLRREKEEREKADLTAKGEHEKVADREKARADAAEAAKLAIGRKAAFVAGASGKVTDVAAAYKLAAADGLLKDLALDDEGEPKDPKAVEATVTSLTKTYGFLKPGDSDDPKDKDKPSDFGAPAGGNGAGAPQPKTAREMMAAGYAENDRRRGRV